MAYISNASPLILNVQIMNNNFSVAAGNYSFNKFSVSLTADTVNNVLRIQDNNIVVNMPFNSVRTPITATLVDLFYALIPYLKIPTAFIYSVSAITTPNLLELETDASTQNSDKKNMSVSVPQDLVSFTNSDACIICYTALSAGNILPGYYTLNKYNTKFGGVTDLLIYNNNFKFIIPLSRITYPSFSSLTDLLYQLNLFLVLPHAVIGV